VKIWQINKVNMPLVQWTTG